MWWICFIFHTDKLTGQCAVLQRNKRFIYYLVNIKHVSNRAFISPSPFVAKLVHFRCSSRGCAAGHKEKGEPQAELRQPETEPGGHEVAVRTGRSDQSVDAAVRVFPPPTPPAPSTSQYLSPPPALNRALFSFSSPVCRAASAVAWID